MSINERPVHPGSFVRSAIVEAHGLSVTRMAKALGVTRPALSALINERADLSAEMAIRIEQVFGIPIETSMRIQSEYDIAKARRRESNFALARFNPSGLDLREPIG